MRRREYGAKFAASERLKFNGAPGFIKLNFINRAGRAQRAAIKFYKAAAQQNVRRLNLKFYPAQVGGADCLNRANLAANTAGDKFSAAKFARRAKLNAPKGRKNLKEKR
ncbi:hypothetical protein [uncultured Campylobacter sp.]|uniref:hypothetical protein n=1 Tax=uncultured Campylobacter sp. TaxID=218934 RepID=UPI00261F890F|nr:hypothetical protein [uncultured Campylobacter sp.]